MLGIHKCHRCGQASEEVFLHTNSDRYSPVKVSLMLQDQIVIINKETKIDYLKAQGTKYDNHRTSTEKGFHYYHTDCAPIYKFPITYHALDLDCSKNIKDLNIGEIGRIYRHFKEEQKDNDTATRFVKAVPYKQYPSLAYKKNGKVLDGKAVRYMTGKLKKLKSTGKIHKLRESDFDPRCNRSTFQKFLTSLSALFSGIKLPIHIINLLSYKIGICRSHSYLKAARGRYKQVKLEKYLSENKVEAQSILKHEFHSLNNLIEVYKEAIKWEKELLKTQWETTKTSLTNLVGIVCITAALLSPILATVSLLTLVATEITLLVFGSFFTYASYKNYNSRGKISLRRADHATTKTWENFMKNKIFTGYDSFKEKLAKE